MTTPYYPPRAATEALWGEVAPHEHAVQLYAHDEAFLDALEGFVGGGLRAGDGIILIATSAHRSALEERLRARRFNLDIARAEDRYLPLDAEAALARFMVKGTPDPLRFDRFVSGLLKRARGRGRRVRSFGEMVALLWHQGQAEATLRLEALWNQLHANEAFTLFCAYPRSHFPAGEHGSVAQICAQHSRLIAL
jgi:hypothetical protein